MAKLKSISRKAYIYASYGLAASIPFTENISTIAITLWVILGLFHLNLPQQVLRSRTGRQQLILPLYFLLTVVALIYTQDVNGGLAHLERKVSFFIIPLVIMLTSDILNPYLKNILKAFVISTMAVTVICVIMAFYHSVSMGEDGIIFNAAVVLKDKSFFESNHFGGNYFFHEHLSLFRHPSYFAIYICFSLFLMVRHILINIKSGRQAILPIICVVYLVVFLFLLSARISFIYIGIDVILIVALYFKRLAIWPKVAMILFLLIFVLLTVKLNYRIINVFGQDFRNTPLIELSQKSNSLKRLVIWKLIIQNEEHFRVFGTGPGDIQETLADYYEKANLTEELKGLNPHNQFLGTYLGMGMVGLVTLLALFAPVFYRESSILDVRLQFLLLSFIFFMVESALERNAFIVFFSFFQPLSMYLNSYQTSKNHLECKKG